MRNRAHFSLRLAALVLAACAAAGCDEGGRGELRLAAGPGSVGGAAPGETAVALEIVWRTSKRAATLVKSVTITDAGTGGTQGVLVMHVLDANGNRVLDADDLVLGMPTRFDAERRASFRDPFFMDWDAEVRSFVVYVLDSTAHGIFEATVASSFDVEIDPPSHERVRVVGAPISGGTLLVERASP